MAIVGGRLFTGLADVTSDVGALDGCGTWIAVLPFDGEPLLARFEESRPSAGWPAAVGAPAAVPPVTRWASSLDRPGYSKRVGVIREAIAAGDVYQVNLCRRLSAPLPPGFDILGLGARLESAHAAPHSAVVRLPSIGVAIASASPERFLGRSGAAVESRPIKGTAVLAELLGAKDRAENVMIVDLVRNDLGRVCEFGSIGVPGLCEVEDHPGLVHLVSTVRGRLRPGTGWADLLGATFPPGSVTGAPKIAALDVIAELEPVPRGLYCGAIGWVDADAGTGDLNVAIRTFWVEDGELHLGTGGGITWDSDPDGEWEETEVKARRLLALAGGAVSP